MQRYIKAQWPRIKPPPIVSYRDGYFVVLMASREDADLVINGGPYCINRQPLLVYQWTDEFDFITDVLGNSLCGLDSLVLQWCIGG